MQSPLQSKTLSIDPASSTGFSIFQGKSLIKCGVFKPSGELNTKLFKIFNFFTDLCVSEGIDRIVVEDFKVGKFAGAAESGYAIRAMFRLLSETLKIPHTVVNISCWHKCIIGKTRATKADKKLYGVNAIKELVKLEVLVKVEVPEKCLNYASGREMVTPYDVYDSIGIFLASS